jgi:hypothetical protein
MGCVSKEGLAEVASCVLDETERGNMTDILASMKMLSNSEFAADALRRHEQAGKRLNDWRLISAAQKRKWLAKVAVVEKAFQVYPRGPLV